MTILQKIQSLITAANNTTGESDTTLTDAVQTLVDGYGQGGTTLPYLQSYEVVNITTDMTTTVAGGNTQSFQNAYLADVSEKPYPTVLILIENTYTGSYAACAAARISSLDKNSPNSATNRVYLRAEGNVNVSSSFSFYIGQGSKLHIYTFRGATE